MLTSRSAFCEYRRRENKPQGNLNSGNEWGETVGGIAKGGGRPRRYVSLHKFTVCLCEDGWERYMCCAVCLEGHIQRSTSGPAGSRTWGLVASAQWLYPDDPGRGGRQTDREKIFTVDSWHGCYFHCLLFWPDLSCFTNPQVFHKHLSHTRSCRAATHSWLSHTLPRSFPFSLSLIQFFHIFPLQRCISLFHLSRVLQVHSVRGKPLTEDKMLRAVVPHSILCNWMAVGVAYWFKSYE